MVHAIAGAGRADPELVPWDGGGCRINNWAPRRPVQSHKIMPKSHRFALPILRTVQFIFAVESLVAILVYCFYTGQFNRHTLRRASEAYGPMVYLFSAAASVVVLIGYLSVSWKAGKRWIQKTLSESRRRLVSIILTTFMSSAWLVAVCVMVPVAINADYNDSLTAMGTSSGNSQQAKLQSLIAKYSSILAVAISCIQAILMVFSLGLLILSRTESELFDIESDNSSEIILDWLDATAKYVSKPTSEKEAAELSAEVELQKAAVQQ
ncbi:MAG: hypothetical protein SGCHY_000310 [Lobulomycetales sp.]